MRASVITLILLLLTGCQVTPPVEQIALISTFEGRYQAIGYDALYAVRLALHDGASELNLLALDDGGTVEQAARRIQAIALNPTVKGVILIGPFATHPDILAPIHHLNPIVVGEWGYTGYDSSVLRLAHPELESDGVYQSLLIGGSTISGGPILALSQVPDVTGASQIEVYTSGTRPPDDFTERYIESDLYVPEPGLLTTLIYDSATVLITAIESQQPPNSITIDGLNGNISFDAAGQWASAPRHHYRWRDNVWQLINSQ